MFRTKISAAFAFAALSFAAPALADVPATVAVTAATPISVDAPIVFSHEGVTYTYTVTSVSRGQVIRGDANGAPFNLMVTKSRVRGTVNGAPVDFARAEVSHVAGLSYAGQ